MEQLLGLLPPNCKYHVKKVKKLVESSESLECHNPLEAIVTLDSVTSEEGLLKWFSDFKVS